MHQRGKRESDDSAALFAALEAFLSSKGLLCTARIGPENQSFGNTIAEYSGQNISARIGKDRSAWFVNLCDIRHRPNYWYAAVFLRPIIEGGEITEMPSTEEVSFVMKNWDALVDSFSDDRHAETHQQIKRLQIERAHRLFPGQPTE
jgi:hypothetical protein